MFHCLPTIHTRSCRSPPDQKRGMGLSVKVSQCLVCEGCCSHQFEIRTLERVSDLFGTPPKSALPPKVRRSLPCPTVQQTSARLRKKTTTNGFAVDARVPSAVGVCVDTRPSYTRADAHFSRAHLTVHNSHSSALVQCGHAALAQGERSFVSRNRLHSLSLRIPGPLRPHSRQVAVDKNPVPPLT